MGPIVHELDSEGDTLLTLHNANAPFAAQNVFYALWSNVLPQFNTWEIRTKEQLSWTAPAESTNTSTTGPIQMRLSSKHLMLASDYFRRMMAHNWKESTPKDGFSFTVTANDWNEEALLTIMRILHGRTTIIPPIVSLEMLAKVAVVIDYYKCHEATHFFTKAWIDNLKEPLPTSFERSLLLRFLVSWVFSEADTFRHLSQIIMRESRGPVNTQGLPIPKAIIDALDKKRQDIISGVISSLDNLKDQFCKGSDGCSFDCSSISLGALMKGMNTMGLLDPPPTPPFHGYSFTALEETVKKIMEPNYKNFYHNISRPVKQPTSGRHQYSKPEPHSCSLIVKINSIIDEQLGKANGLDLNSFINESRSKQASTL